MPLDERENVRTHIYISCRKREVGRKTNSNNRERQVVASQLQGPQNEATIRGISYNSKFVMTDKKKEMATVEKAENCKEKRRGREGRV